MTLTIAAVVAQMHTYGVSSAESEILKPLMGMAVPLPDGLSLFAVRNLLSGYHIILPDVLLRQFRDHALYLALAENRAG